jgi:hypothetical protein
MGQCRLNPSLGFPVLLLEVANLPGISAQPQDTVLGHLRVDEQVASARRGLLARHDGYHDRSHMPRPERFGLHSSSSSPAASQFDPFQGSGTFVLAFSLA